MDVKDLQNEATLGERNNDGSKYASSGVTLPYSRNKAYQDVSSVSLGKVDVPTSRPCAVIGPDRVLPPPVSNDTLKKGAYEAWYTDNVYRYPPEYPHKMTNYHTPIRNISPRQTFQENMQRIMVPPSYNSLKGNEEHHFPLDKNVSLPKNTKPNIPLETKYCEVPYSGSLTNNEQKSVRNTEQCVSNVNPVLARSVPQGWSSHVRPPRPYGAPELYQYPDYTNCAGPRPVPISRTHRTTHEDLSQGYPDPYCHDGNIRFKPYTTVKERYPQARYEFIGNYPSPFHAPSAFPPHKYDMPKSIPQPYAYPQPTFKYLDSRIPDPLIEGYQRPPQQNNYNLPFPNQMMHPAYGPVLGNCMQNKFPCPPEGSVKSVAPNKPPYDANKMYADYENARTKGFPVSENYYFNEMQRPPHHIKNQVMPSYPVNMHGIHPHPYYRKDSSTIKNYEYMPHFRNIDPSLLSQSRIPSQFSPNAITISPPDTNLTLDSTQIQGGTQEDCGYVSQSPTASVRSVEYVNRTANDFYRRYDSRYGATIRPPPIMAKPEQNPNGNSKDKKDIDVRQFLQMWNEVDDENAENANKEAVVQLLPNDVNKTSTQYETIKSQDQLYVLGLVNVPSEELGKYEHIQKVSKLPENIKGYNSIELLNQFEEVIESSNVNSFKTKSCISRDVNYQMSMKNPVSHHSLGLLPRPVSPLDVEAKISQSVIHKEVGCNFEIKPCSPKMLNVEAATPIQNLLGERAIEKVSNTLIVSPPILHEDDLNCKILTRQDQNKSSNENMKNASCKMTNTQFNNNDSVRPDYSIQDLESNSGVCLASLPRLDNDIELNFPEVNQQFINANKGESVITATKDLPSLINLDYTENESSKTENNLREQPGANYEFPSIIESEREFSKLSKYRKIKKCGSESLEKETSSISSIQNMRTDSVIIKNPENSKMSEQNKDIVSANSLDFTQDRVTENKKTIGDEVDTDKVFSNELDKSIVTSMDIAIDFSLNKNDNFASGADDHYDENRLKSLNINKIKHRTKVTQNESSNLKKEREIEPTPLQISEADSLIGNETENKISQPQELHDHHDTTVPVKEQVHYRNEFSMYKKCDRRNEDKEYNLESQLCNDSAQINEENKYVTDKTGDNNKNYDYPKETYNINISTVNDYEDTNMSTQTDVNTHFDTSDFENASSSHKSDTTGKKHKSGSFELFSEESDEYDTDSTGNEIKNMLEKSGSTNDKNHCIEKLCIEEDRIHNKGEILDIIDDNRKSNIEERRSDIKDETNIISEKTETAVIISETYAKETKLNAGDDIIVTKLEVKISDTINETDEAAENSGIKNDKSDLERDTIQTVKLKEDSDIQDKNDREQEVPNVKKDENNDNEVEQIINNDDRNETDKVKGKRYVENENIKHSVKLEEKHNTKNMDVEENSFISTDAKIHENKQINTKLLLTNTSHNNDLNNCVTIVNDAAEELKESDTNNILNNLDILDKLTKSHYENVTTVQTMTNESVSNSNQTYENNKEFLGNDEYLLDTENKQVDNFLKSTTPLTKNDSLNKCESFVDAKIATQIEMDTKETAQTKENVVSSKNKSVENSKTSLLLECASNNCKDYENDRKVRLPTCTKQVYENEMLFVKCIENEKPFFIPSENKLQESTKCEDSHEQLHEYFDETKNSNISYEETGHSKAVSLTIDTSIENAQNIYKLCNLDEDSNQQSLLKSSNSDTMNENIDQLPLLFKSSTIISPIHSDEDSSNLSKPHLDMSHEIDNLGNDSNYHSNLNVCVHESPDQNTVQLNVPPLGNGMACEKLKDQACSDVLKITYANTLAENINGEKSCRNKMKYNFQANLGLQKELFSPFIQKLISYKEGYCSNLLVNNNTKCNSFISNKVDNDEVEHVKRDDYNVQRREIEISYDSISINVEETLDDTMSKCENSYKTDNDDYVSTNNAIISHNDAQVITGVSISLRAQNNKDDTLFVNSDLCSEIIQDEHFDFHTKLTDDADKYKSNETTLAHNINSNENCINNEICTPSPNNSMSKFYSETYHGTNVRTNKQLEDNYSDPIPNKNAQNHDEAALNNEYNIKGALKVEASHDLGNNNIFMSANRSCLKRSLSDSALDSFNDSSDAFYSGWQPKRSKKKFRNIVEPDIIFESNCQTHRRKSISSVYNEQNLSFCILIDNDCIITEEEESEEQGEVCYSEIPEGCVTDIPETVNEYENVISPNTVSCPEETNPEYSVTQGIEEKLFEESWVDDVGCIETVVSDVAEDITISASSSPERIHSPENEESGIFMNSEHTDKVKHIYGNKMCNDDIMFLETLYRTPQMNVNKVINRESQIPDECIQYYNKDSLEKVLSGCHSHEDLRSDLDPSANSFHPIESAQGAMEKHLDATSVSPAEEYFLMRNIYNNNENDNDETFITTPDKTQDDTVHSCESSIDNVFSYNQRDDYTTYTSSTSPEVSSTTSEERNSGILLKITNYKGSRISQINDFEQETKSISCKFTELNDYSSSQNFKQNRPLITKAAQKYIPPLKETFGDLKIRLPLPQHSLLRLKQLKLLKEESKLSKFNIKSKPDIPKKPKPKFEDVLKSIDEIQFKMHKEKSKKTKKSIPKVVIKKNENGSHYASTTNREPFNPDLTGRKWQPWVFLEKNHFIDKMALRNKRKAIFNHRKNTYVLAEKFRKYKSIGNAKFVISQPNVHNSSIGHLKCTIRLKHTY